VTTQGAVEAESEPVDTESRVSATAVLAPPERPAESLSVTNEQELTEAIAVLEEAGGGVIWLEKGSSYRFDRIHDREGLAGHWPGDPL